MTNQRLVVSTSPHVKNGRTLRGMIMTTMLALTPAALWGFFQFGLDAIALVHRKGQRRSPSIMIIRLYDK